MFFEHIAAFVIMFSSHQGNMVSQFGSVAYWFVVIFIFLLVL